MCAKSLQPANFKRIKWWNLQIDLGSTKHGAAYEIVEPLPISKEFYIFCQRIRILFFWSDDFGNFRISPTARTQLVNANTNLSYGFADFQNMRVYHAKHANSLVEPFFKFVEIHAQQQLILQHFQGM